MKTIKTNLKNKFMLRSGVHGPQPHCMRNEKTGKIRTGPDQDRTNLKQDRLGQGPLISGGLWIAGHG